MTDDERFLISRFKELSNRSFNRGIWTFSDFLSLAEQSLVHAAVQYDYQLWGGFENAERKIAVFGSEDLCGYKADMPLKIVRIEPVSQKFADALTHRDYLGAIMSLGVKREVLGDILINENCGYVFCLDTIAEFLRDNILQVKHTTVHCDILDELPEIAKGEPQYKEVLVSSERLDAIISAVFNLSRSDAKELFADRKIFVDSREVASASFSLSADSIVSVRGKGRFKYCGTVRQTKKGRMAIAVEVY